jgi:hypothetical protein
MATVSSKDLEAIQQFENWVPVWSANAVAIGTTTATVTALDLKVKAARNGYTAQQAAKMAAKTATNVFHDAVDLMRDAGADIIRQIRTQAEVTNNPNVYNLAQVPPPAPPTPAPLPGQPTNFSVGLTGSGGILLTWKSANSSPSSGAYFTVRRRLAGESTFTVAGGTGSKSFVDDTVPFGTNMVTYLVQGFKGQAAGPESEQLTVQFGVGGAGASATAQFKLAA